MLGPERNATPNPALGGGLVRGVAAAPPGAVLRAEYLGVFERKRGQKPPAAPIFAPSLRVVGRIDFAKYEGLEPVYTEYNVGHYTRSFALSDTVDQERIDAQLADGVLTLTLPKVAAARPRRIALK